MKSFCVASVLIALAGYAQAQDKIDRLTLDKMEAFNPDTLDWKDEPILPKGAKSVLVVGDPATTGPWGITYIDPKDDPRK